MSKSQNIHDTKKWKQKRKTHLADKCRKAKCTICHSGKVLGVTKKKYK